MSEEKIPIEYYLTKNGEVIKFVRYDELDKYKEVLDKIKEYIKGTQIYGMRSGKTLLQKYMNDILELLEEIDE